MSPVGLKLFLDVMVFALGAAIGSFLNVCIYRMPHNLSVVTPGSRCGACKTPIAWFDNIPLVSWCVLRGKCRYCGVKFSFRYWLVELLTAALFLGVWLKFGPDFSAKVAEGQMLSWRDLLPSVVVPIYWLLIGGLIVATFIDLDHYIIPDEISLGGVVVGFVLNLVIPLLARGEPSVVGPFDSLLGILIGSGLVLWLAIYGEIIFRKEAMGFGDVKFLGMIGAFLGWQAAIFTLVISSLVGAVVGLLWIALSKERKAIASEANPEAVYHSLDSWSFRDEMDTHAMRSSIPYGPFLAVGAVVWIFVGSHVQRWYAPLFQFN
jgi:leader peptidase (prepilin peptidase)/N-methyltransferase